MTSPAPRTSPFGWALLIAGVVALVAFLTLMISPLYALVVPFWALCVWAVFWVIRLGVRYGVNDALQSNRDWMTAPDHERIPSQGTRA